MFFYHHWDDVVSTPIEETMYIYKLTGHTRESIWFIDLSSQVTYGDLEY